LSSFADDDVASKLAYDFLVAPGPQARGAQPPRLPSLDPPLVLCLIDARQ